MLCHLCFESIVGRGATPFQERFHALSRRRHALDIHTAGGKFTSPLRTQVLAHEKRIAEHAESGRSRLCLHSSPSFGFLNNRLPHEPACHFAPAQTRFPCACTHPGTIWITIQS